MFGNWFGELVRQLFVLFSTISTFLAMCLSRCESYKWMKRRLFHQDCSKNVSSFTNYNVSAVEKANVRTMCFNTNSNSNTKSQINCKISNANSKIVEVLAENDENFEALPPVEHDKVAKQQIKTDNNGISDSNTNEGTADISGRCCIAPIAEEECCSECEFHIASAQPIKMCFIDEKQKHVPPTNKKTVSDNTAVKRSKSRVRTYLKKCKDRLTGQHQRAYVIKETCSTKQSSQLTAVQEDCNYDNTCLPPVESTNVALSHTQHNAYEADNNNDDHAYEEYDFSQVATTATAPQNEAVIADTENVMQSEIMEHLACAIDLKTNIETLLDRYLSNIFPFYFEKTRATLLQQAHDLLDSSYNGCLKSFEQKFLQQFAKTALELKQKHRIGESILWQLGWPLVTPIGELILHLGALNDAELQPFEIYLCVKTANNCETPKLFAVWRSAQSQSESAIQSCCFDYTDPKAYLSGLTLEMLSDDLPQLLQNLLVGVERTLGRISLNDVQIPKHMGDVQQLATDDEANNNFVQVQNSLDDAAAATRRTSVTNSPKCVLKRSELITKNKMISNRYMLRRLTNRQDSINSTSSGNSCGSSGSASSEELSYYNLSKKVVSDDNNSSCNKHNQSVATTSAATTMTTTTAISTSPALPLFCLGNSFPHIDSDEENADDKRNFNEEDHQFDAEIIPPSSITEIPEKLLTTGINLPGTRDMKGNPIVTVDADSVAAAGLNCYELATVLLYYSTIPEINLIDCVSNCGHNENTIKEIPTAASTITATNNIAIKRVQQNFTILIMIEKMQHMCVIDLICQSLKLIAKQFMHCEILVTSLDKNLLQFYNRNNISHINKSENNVVDNNSNWLKQQQQQQHLQQHQQSQQTVKFISADEVTTSVAPSQIPYGKLRGLHHHDPRKWCEFFILLEPFQQQCAAAGQRLVAAMSDIRSADLQGLPTRRQLYAQHRALSRALMDSELHNLRKRGSATLQRLQELSQNINKSHSHSDSHKSNKTDSNSTGSKLLPTTTTVSISSNDTKTSSSNKMTSSVDTALDTTTASLVVGQLDNNINCNSNSDDNNKNNNIDVATKLHKVTLLFNEVDRAAKRLEQLTEQRRERLRELTRQRALEDEINEVTSWISSDGNETLQKFTNLSLDCEQAVKAHEHDFEKYYFISMKHLAKGRDLHDAAASVETLRESAVNLKMALDCFGEKLELARERIEGASRLYHLLSLHLKEENMQQEIQRLAEKIGLTDLLINYDLPQQIQQQQEQTDTNDAITSETRNTPTSLHLQNSYQSSAAVITKTQSSHITTSTPITKTNRSSNRSSSGNGSYDGQICQCWRESRNLEFMDDLLTAEEEEEDGEEEQSKIADSGLGGCDRCEGNPKLSRICSCQSLNEAGNLYEKCHNSDELDDDCYERPTKRYLDIRSPIEANAHLQCHASNLELPKLEELSCLDPKIQKTLLLIMREMIGTERDYVRSLYYVIDNYVDELLRDDIPQPLRGQRNVIFGNIEKIFEFHSSHFLNELERYEHNPLKVGAAFLETESKFYLYALYNKNKPKSDTLMSEYGTAFFKSKQFELNDKMDLASYLLKPVQRMGKYALLLQQLVKACNSAEASALQEISGDVEELQRAEEMVKFQLRHGNDLLAMDSLRDCDVNVKEQGRLLRQNEFLVWQGRGGKKSLRQVFLFEDLVLFSKARRFPDHKNLDIYIYKNSIKTSDIGLTAHVGDSPTKFEIWFRKRKPEDTWTLQCMSEDIKNAWTDEISKLLWQQAKRNREIRLAEMSSMGIGSKPCLDIRPSNNQINDRSITISQLGKAPKLRHSFVGVQAEQGKPSRRPHSFISESSMSSGTSSSSLSTGSIGSMGKTSGMQNQTLELINETQALMLSSAKSKANEHNNSYQQHKHNSSSNGNNNRNSCNLRNHKRSTTLVSQLSMESGILSDISMTPDQEQTEAITEVLPNVLYSHGTVTATMPITTFATNNTPSIVTSTTQTTTTTTTTTTATVILRQQKKSNK